VKRRLGKQGGSRVAAVTWTKAFPDRGPGVYLASFAYQAHRFGPTMSFTR